MDWIGLGQDFEETLWIGLGPMTAISDGQITNQITSTNHKSFAKMI